MALVLFPVRSLGWIEYFFIIIAPAICALTLCAWRWIDLPNSNGIAGQRIARLLGYAMWVSLALMALITLDGDSLVFYVLLIYIPTFLVIWARFGEVSVQMKRAVRMWVLFVPLVFEYRLLIWWGTYAHVSEEPLRLAFDRLHGKYAPRVFNLIVDLGGVFIKIGQLLSLIPKGVLPDAYTDEFKKLQSTVPPRPTEVVRQLISEGLGRHMDEVFSRFDDKPLGAASIGQVHRAQLKADGREVVVKVQYPEVSSTIDPDFDNAIRVVWMLDKSKVPEVREAKEHFRDELNFEHEAATLQRISSSMKKPFPSVRVPEPISGLCSQTVLVMTFIDGMTLLDGLMQMAQTIASTLGITVDEMMAQATKTANQHDSGPAAESSPAQPALPEAVPELPEPKQSGLRSKLAGVVPTVTPATGVKLLQNCMSTSRAAMNVGVTMYNHSVAKLGATPLQYREGLPKFDPSDLSETMWRVHGHQFLVEGLFNTDPHPGNVLITKAGELGLIDFGQVCDIELETRVRFSRLLVALAMNDENQIVRRHAQLGFKTTGMWHEHVLLAARMRFGDARILTKGNMQRVDELSKLDTVLEQRKDQSMVRVERLIAILRGTSFILGVPTAHSALTLWLGMAKELLTEHDASFPEGFEDGQVLGRAMAIEDDQEEEEFFDAEDEQILQQLCVGGLGS